MRFLKAKIICELIPIPKDSREWRDFCKGLDIKPLWGDARKGWIRSLGTYVRGADYLILLRGNIIGTAFQAEVDRGDVEVVEKRSGF